MTRHPCFVCGDVGSFRHEHERIACDCAAGQRLSPPVPTYFSAKNQYDAASDGTPMIQPDAAPDIPAPMPAMPTSPSSTNTSATNQLVMGSLSMEG